MQDGIQGTQGRENKPLRLTKRIGSTTYKVSVHFSKTSKETLTDKLIRLIGMDTTEKRETHLATTTKTSAANTQGCLERGRHEQRKTENRIREIEP